MLTHDHFHSNTHEVLGVSKGKVKLMIGGQKTGKMFEVSEGDVLALPAGVGHYSIQSNTPYEIVGGYPEGRSWDMMTGTIEERKSAFINIAAVPHTKNGSIVWSRRAIDSIVEIIIKGILSETKQNCRHHFLLRKWILTCQSYGKASGITAIT